MQGKALAGHFVLRPQAPLSQPCARGCCSVVLLLEINPREAVWLLCRWRGSSPKCWHGALMPAVSQASAAGMGRVMAALGAALREPLRALGAPSRLRTFEGLVRRAPSPCPHMLLPRCYPRKCLTEHCPSSLGSSPPQVLKCSP